MISDIWRTSDTSWASADSTLTGRTMTQSQEMHPNIVLSLILWSVELPSTNSVSQVWQFHMVFHVRDFVGGKYFIPILGLATYYRSKVKKNCSQQCIQNIQCMIADWSPHRNDSLGRLLDLTRSLMNVEWRLDSPFHPSLWLSCLETHNRHWTGCLNGAVLPMSTWWWTKSLWPSFVLPKVNTSVFAVIIFFMSCTCWSVKPLPLSNKSAEKSFSSHSLSWVAPQAGESEHRRMLDGSNLPVFGDAILAVPSWSCVYTISAGVTLLWLVSCRFLHLESVGCYSHLTNNVWLSQCFTFPVYSEWMSFLFLRIQFLWGNGMAFLVRPKKEVQHP